MYNSFYKQVTTRVYQNVFQAYSPTSRKVRVFKPRRSILTRFAIEEFFFLRVISRKKEEKFSTDELPTRKVKRFAVEFFVL